MPDAMQRQTNAFPHTAQIPEFRSPDGVVLPARDVDPGESVDYPYRLVGFDGWAEPDKDEPAAPETEPESTQTPAKAAKKSAPAATEKAVTA